MSGTTDVILLVYIRTNHLVKSRSFFFKEFANMSKSIILRNIGLDKILVMKLKQVFILLKMSFKIPLKLLYHV